MGCANTKPNIQSPNPIHHAILDSEIRQNSGLHDTKEILQIDQTTIINSTGSINIPQTLNDLSKIIVPETATDSLNPIQQLKAIDIGKPSKVIQSKLQDAADDLNTGKPVEKSSEKENQLRKENIDEDYLCDEEDSILKDYLSLFDCEQPKKHVESLFQQIPAESDIQGMSSCERRFSSSKEESLKPSSTHMSKVTSYIGKSVYS